MITIATAPRLSTLEMLARLVAFDTVSRNSNLALIEFVRSWLDAHGVFYRVTFSPDGAKANIHAVIGPQSDGGIALSGHVDTVPVDGQTWSSDPFALRRDGVRAYGRGTTDMKGFVAACLAAVPDVLARGLSRPLHLFITYDEETTMEGARRMIADLGESGLRPEMCIVGEPSLMQPVLAHKGRLAVRARVQGRGGHSSQPARGVNAVHAGAEAIAIVAREGRRRVTEGPFVEGFDPPYTTVHVGTFSGGTILNMIPEHAEFVMEWRTVPGDDPLTELDALRREVARNIEPEMHRVDPATGFTFEATEWCPPMSLDADHALVGLVRGITGANTTGRVSYGTEGGLYQEAGIATIVCGPGAIAQAHQPDEWIAEDQLAACDAFVRRVADRLAP
ncbi:MAG TPA: acetylornithine deacetylase [Acetobacteraceae bacterium]|jgi:acetylornithine deacetylase|nr:acetylornithine deacetylase [Acetobacteraceae bacterium]